MKEEVAKTKWCPHTRMVFGYEQGTTQPFNRFMCEPGDEIKKMQEAMNGTSGTKCIGSGCMMWDATQKVEDKLVKETANRDDCMPDGDGWYLVNRRTNPGKTDEILWRRYVDTDDGDCGLKSQPLVCES